MSRHHTHQACAGYHGIKIGHMAATSGGSTTHRQPDDFGPGANAATSGSFEDNQA